MSSVDLTLCYTVLQESTIIAQHIRISFAQTPCMKQTLVTVPRVCTKYRFHCNLLLLEYFKTYISLIMAT